MAVITCTARNATDSSEMLRCSPVTTNLGRPGRRPWRFTSTPSSTTAVSRSRLTTPVARLAYHIAVLPVIPFMSHPSPGSLLWQEHGRQGAALPLAHLSIGSERSGLPRSCPGWGRREWIRYTYESANVAASHRRQYVYDPANPSPTSGGPLCCDSEHLGPGARDQRAVEARSDVLIYSTPPLEQDLEVTGPVQLELFAKSSAVDTDFTAKLVDVGPDGFAQNLTEGIVRARYRNSQEKAERMSPGQIYKFTVDLWATANVFHKGHMLRLEVSSSNFPRFDKNQNTGDDAGVGGKSVAATNTIYHDAEHPSALILPIVPTT